MNLNGYMENKRSIEFTIKSAAYLLKYFITFLSRKKYLNFKLYEREKEKGIEIISSAILTKSLLKIINYIAFFIIVYFSH